MTSTKELSEGDIKKIITEWAERTYGQKVTGVRVNVGLQQTGYGYWERSEPAFNGVTVELEEPLSAG